MLAIILSTAFARGMYDQMPLSKQTEHAFERGLTHFKEGRTDKAIKWFKRGQEAFDKVAAQIQKIDILLSSLAEKKGTLEQMFLDAQDAAAKTERARIEFETINAQIADLTAQKDGLMNKIVKQAQQADVTAAEAVTNPPILPPASSVSEEPVRVDIPPTPPVPLERPAASPVEQPTAVASELGSPGLANGNVGQPASLEQTSVEASSPVAQPIAAAGKNAEQLVTSESVVQPNEPATAPQSPTMAPASLAASFAGTEQPTTELIKDSRNQGPSTAEPISVTPVTSVPAV